MRSRLLITVSAAALIAGAGLATAQEKGGSMGGPAGAPQGASPAQQSAPAQPGGNGMKGGEPQQRQEAPPVRAEQRMDRGDQQKGAQDQRQPRENRAQDQRNQRQERAQDKSSPKAGSTATDTKSDRKNGGAATTGQGAAGGSGSASLTTEQRTKISGSIRQSHVAKVTNVNFNVSVGTVVPRTVTLHALPTTVVEVYPQWRGYRFILVEDEILIIEPASHRIVAVIEA